MDQTQWGISSKVFQGKQQFLHKLLAAEQGHQPINIETIHGHGISAEDPRSHQFTVADSQSQLI